MTDHTPARTQALQAVAEAALWFHDALHAGAKAVDERRPPCDCRLALALQALSRLAEPEEACRYCGVQHAEADACTERAYLANDAPGDRSRDKTLRRRPR